MNAERVALLAITVEGTAIGWSWCSPDETMPHGQQSETLHLPPRRRQMLELLVGLLRHSTDVAETATNLEKTHHETRNHVYSYLLEVVGYELYDLLFVGKIREKVNETLNGEHNADRFRMELSFLGEYGEWLSGLPWEYTHTTPDRHSDGEFLADYAELVLSRRLVREFPGFSIVRPPVRLLLVCSSPVDGERDGLQQIDADQVLRELERLQERRIVKLEALIEPSAPSFRGDDYRPTVTWQAFMDSVEAFEPTIIHFIGHGRRRNGAGELAFAAGDSGPDWIVDREFVRVARRCRRSLRLVFLQACESALPDPYVSFSGVARQLASAGLPAVVGMQYRIKAAAANEFAVRFYSELFDDGQQLSSAVQAGRRQLINQRGRYSLAFGLPVLYLSDDAAFDLRLEHEPAGLGSRSVDRGDTELVQLRCPRCHEPLEGPAPKVCVNCLLRLRCPEPGCGTPYRDPLADEACSNCRAPLRQVPFTPDAIRDLEGTVPDIEANVISALRGPAVQAR